MTRAAIYARYSSDRQSEASCEDQIRECRRFAETKGWTVAEAAVVSEEGISGASRHNRPGLLALVAEAGETYDVLLAYDVSRLGRNDEDVAWVRNRLSARGVRCVEAANGDDLGSLSSRVRGLLAAEYREELGRHTRRGLRGQFERGYVPGAAPFGYRLERDPAVNDPSRKCARLVIHEAAAEVVRRIFDASATGQGAKGIARRLNAERAPAPVPRASKVRPSWSPTSIHALLGNPIYRGELVWGRTRWVKDHATGRRRCLPVPEAEWLRRDAPELGIVDETLWHAANAARERRGRRIERSADGRQIAGSRGSRRAGRYLLSGLLECGACGAAFCAQDRHRWGCNGAHQRGICGEHVIVARNALEATVLRGIESLLDPEALESVARLAEAEVAKALADRARPEQLEAELVRVEARMARLVTWPPRETRRPTSSGRSSGSSSTSGAGSAPSASRPGRRCPPGARSRTPSAARWARCSRRCAQTPRGPGTCSWRTSPASRFAWRVTATPTGSRACSSSK